MTTKTIAVSAAGRALGEDAPRARWTDAQVAELRRRVDAGERITTAAAALGMTFATARDLIRGRRRCGLPAAWVTVRDGRRGPPIG